MVKKIVSVVANSIMALAIINVSTASMLIGYQPRVPESLRK